jgi:excinuclease UvrABC ATPase subunit
VIATGTPEDVAEVDGSATGQYLRRIIPAREPAAA